MLAKRILAALALPLASAIVVCGSTPADPPSLPPTATAPTTLPTTAPVAEHWVRDARLRVVMDQLSLRTNQGRWPKEMPKEAEGTTNRSTEWYFGQAVLLANDLAATAQRIPQNVDVSKMSDADRAGFTAEAATLHEQALNLGDAAMARKVERMERLMDGINSTCISCHSRYRDFAGQIDLTQLKIRGT